MRNDFVLLLFFCAATFCAFNSSGQPISQYTTPVTRQHHVPALKDSVRITCYYPAEKFLAPGKAYPLLILFDQQNTVNYQYNLRTIEYLTSLGEMPPVVIAAVSFPGMQRTRWTIPSSDKGQADSLLSFLFGPFRQELIAGCPLADYTILCGHSRTAMLAQYTLAAYPDKVQVAIAASNSFFDFNTLARQQEFERFLSHLNSTSRPHFLFFSSGTAATGDAHEESVNKLVRYLQQKKLPARFHWKHYREPASHISTPGLTVPRALNELFSPYSAAMQSAFDLLNKPRQTDSIPWSAYHAIWNIAGQKTGLIQPFSLTFFNSLASGYLNDYNEIYKEHKYKLALNILDKAILTYPDYPGFYSFYAAVLLETGDRKGAAEWILKAREKLPVMGAFPPDQYAEEAASITEVESALTGQ